MKKMFCFGYIKTYNLLANSHITRSQLVKWIIRASELPVVMILVSSANIIGLGAIHTSELDRSEIDLSSKRSECERSNAN